MQKKSTVNDLPAVVPDCPVFGLKRLKIAGLLFTIMKVTLIQMTVAMIFSGVSIAFESHAQEILKRKVSLEVKDISLMEALGEIEKAANVKFVYSPARIRINLDEKISLNVSKQKLGALLSELLIPRSIKFKVQEGDDYIILVENEKADFSLLQLEDPVKEEIMLATISGRVSDTGGNPMPGVNILQKGTTNGTSTDAEGKYSLFVSEGDAILVFSFIGYITQEVAVNGRSAIDVTLLEDVQSLEEVVIIGYGTQKKANLTGSVTTIEADEIIKRPGTNVAGLLQGKITGLQVSSHSGKPGDESNLLRIRGSGTFSAAGNEPLVLINGIAGDMTNLDPNDVESISVLKDAASSAIYGARAANGVILITTKRGKAEPLSIQFHSNVQVQNATRLPELLYNSADYMMYWNEGMARAGQAPYFTQEEIDAFRNNTDDPVNYPNFNWIDHAFKPAVANTQSLSIGGGNEKTTFNLSLGYFNQPGITSLYEFKKYNARITVDTKLKDWITIGGDIQLVNKNIEKSNWEDIYNPDHQVVAIYGSAPNYTPTMTLPDGTTGYVARYSSAIGQWTVRNPDAQDASGVQTVIDYNILPQFYAEIKPFKDFTWYTKGAVSYDTRTIKNHETEVDNYFFKDGAYAHNNSTWKLGVQETWSTRIWTTFYSTLNYRRLFNETHNVNILGGYNQEYDLDRSISGSRTHFPTKELKELDAGAALDQTTGGYSSEWAIMSFFGRAMYDFKGKYLFEANARFDGTSRISPDNRWGFFPSISAGWRVSEESFLQQSGWLQDLKIRASWGQLGNQNVGLYPYQEVLSTTSYAFSTAYPGAYMTRMVDPSLRWETTTMKDVGFDLSVREGLFNVTFDWFDKVTDDILYNIPIPASVGLSAPTVNYGKMRNTGVEIELGSAKQLGDFRYDVSLNFSTFRNEVLRVLSPFYGNFIIQEGLPFGSHYLTEWIGIFQNEAEIEAGPKHQFNPKPGDLKFKDQNGDNVIDAKDRVVVDGAFPKFYYGATINLSWKNFDLNVFFQGIDGYKQSAQGAWGRSAYTQGSPPPMDFVRNMWTGEGSTNEHPAMYISGYGPVTGTRSTYWLLDASYLRLKNLAIGYNIPNNLSRKIGFQYARVYCSGDNLLTFTKWPGSDPEKFSGHQTYPQLTTYTLGMKVKF